jgi:hypothetical protein
VRRVTESDLSIAEIQPVDRSAPPAAVAAAVSGAVVEIVRGMRSEKYNVNRSN